MDDSTMTKNGIYNITACDSVRTIKASAGFCAGTACEQEQDIKVGDVGYVGTTKCKIVGIGDDNLYVKTELSGVLYEVRRSMFSDTPQDSLELIAEDLMLAPAVYCRKYVLDTSEDVAHGPDKRIKRIQINHIVSRIQLLILKSIDECMSSPQIILSQTTEQGEL